MPAYYSYYPKDESDRDIFWLFLPIGMGIALGLFGGPRWAIWASACTTAFSLGHIVLKSGHYRWYRANVGGSVVVYFMMRLVVESLKIGIPIAMVFLTRGAPFKLGSRTPWPGDAKVAYAASCRSDLVTQGFSVENAVAMCGCIADGLENEFGTEEYPAAVDAQPRQNGKGVERRLHRVLSGCFPR